MRGRTAGSSASATRRTARRCGEPCKRGQPRRRRRYVYVGDGYSDRCAALAADRIFARDSLATHLDHLGVPYERFYDLHDVAALLRGT